MDDGRLVCQAKARPSIEAKAAWLEARRVFPLGKAKAMRNLAMHITLGETKGIKPAAREILRALVDGCFPDSIRRSRDRRGEHLLLKVDMSVGRIAKRAGWCDIDEGEEETATDDQRRALRNAKDRAQRALGQLVAAGIITRCRVNGGRSITLIELRAPFEPTDAPPAEAPEPDAKAQNRSGENPPPETAETRQPEGDEHVNRRRENTSPPPSSPPPSSPRSHPAAAGTAVVETPTPDATAAAAAATSRNDDQNADPDAERRMSAVLDALMVAGLDPTPRVRAIAARLAGSGATDADIAGLKHDFHAKHTNPKKPPVSKGLLVTMAEALADRIEARKRVEASKPAIPADDKPVDPLDVAWRRCPAGTRNDILYDAKKMGFFVDGRWTPDGVGYLADRLRSLNLYNG